jgi:hypothetical protein
MIHCVSTNYAVAAALYAMQHYNLLLMLTQLRGLSIQRVR